MDQTRILQKITMEVSPDKALWVGFSGGLDSTVLLHLLATSSVGSNVRAVHVHHGLSKHADRWVIHCQKVCDAFNVPLQVEYVNLRTRDSKKGLENAAREARYAAFVDVIDEGEVLALAHHQNDQAETVLYRLARGTGLAGVAGMLEKRTLADMNVVRPLLDCSRAQLEAYAAANHLEWVEDESNSSDEFDRNYIRQNIIPAFEARWPQFAKKISESAQVIAEQSSLLNTYLSEELECLDLRKERVGHSINLMLFARLNNNKQKALIRFWCERAALATPNTAHLKKLADVIDAREDASPCLDWGNAELRRFNQRIYLLPKLDWSTLTHHTWNTRKAIDLGQGFFLDCDPLIDLDFEICSRKNSQRCKPLGRNHSQTIKKLLQEYKLEPWLRDIVPCVYYSGELIAVADLWMCASDKLDANVTFNWSFRG